MKKVIYFDYAATTPVDPRVLKAMKPFFSHRFANPASLHQLGQQANQAVAASRASLAHFLGVDSEEIYFTGSATESNNLVLKGLAFAYLKAHGWLNFSAQPLRTAQPPSSLPQIIVSAIEHDCIVNSAKWLTGLGFPVYFLKVDRDGFFDLTALEQALKQQPTLVVSLMHANNEIGTLQPLSKIAKLCHRYQTLFHSDAAQSLGKIPLDQKNGHQIRLIGLDLMTASAHKIYGPKGVALLYIKKGLQLEPILHGGGQEAGLRSSTANVPAIVGFAAAVKIAALEMETEAQRQIKLRDRLIKGILTQIPHSYLNGHPQERLPNNVNISFDFIEGEALIMHLSFHGIMASTGSACSSAKLEPSHVLIAIGRKPEQAHGSLRISLGRQTTVAEIDYLLKVLSKVVAELRKISPFKSAD